MGLLERAKRDIQRISSNAATGFATELVFTAPTGETATINGLHTKHSLGVDDEGNPVHSTNAHVSFSESLLTALDYPTRNDDGDVNLKNHKVTAADANGTICTYVLGNVFENETTGLIVCTLLNYNV